MLSSVSKFDMYDEAERLSFIRAALQYGYSQGAADTEAGTVKSPARVRLDAVKMEPTMLQFITPDEEEAREMAVHRFRQAYPRGYSDGARSDSTTYVTLGTPTAVSAFEAAVFFDAASNSFGYRPMIHRWDGSTWVGKDRTGYHNDEQAMGGAWTWYTKYWQGKEAP